jgi:hypothetical protein
VGSRRRRADRDLHGELNGVIVTGRPGTTAPTLASAKRDDVARLKAAVPALQLKSIEAVKLPQGTTRSSRYEMSRSS